MLKALLLKVLLLLKLLKSPSVMLLLINKLLPISVAILLIRVLKGTKRRRWRETDLLL
jgi:hypothetical protein